MIRYSLLAWSVLAVAFAGGCAEPQKRPDPVDEALKDPAHYTPSVGNQDISGGGTLDLDRNALRKDVDNVLNP